MGKLVKYEKVNMVSFLSFDFAGLEIVPKKHNKSNMINASKIIIVDERYERNIMRKKLNKKFLKICKSVYVVLSSEEDDTTDVVNLLGSLAKFKSSLFNKYKKYLSEIEKEKFIKKIELFNIELKKKIISIELNKMFDKENAYYKYEDAFNKDKNKSR